MSDAGPHNPPADPASPPPDPASPPPDEFAGIPSRRGRHPILAAGVVALAVFLVVRLWDDLSFALSTGQPRDLGDARTLASTPIDQLPVNRLVRVAGTADRESAVILDTQGSWQFTQFFRVLGSGNRLFVRRVPDPLPVPLTERDVFTGRLVPVSDLTFAASIRNHFTASVTATHFFAPPVFHAALAAGGQAVTDLLGASVPLTPQVELAIDVARPDAIRVELPRTRFADPAAARTAVEAQGGEVLGAPTTSGEQQVVVARFPPQKRDAALSALGDLDRRVRIAQARETVRVRRGELSATADGLQVGGSEPRVLPLAEVRTIRTLAPVVIPPDALLLVEGERPRDHLRAVIAAAVLLGFAIVNLLALRRTS